MHPTAWWQPYLPFVAIGVVLLLRLRRVNKAQRMRLGRLLAGPIIVGTLAVFLFFSAPPGLAGLAIFVGGAIVGAALGWQRARLMKVAFDPVSGTFTLRQSPWAVVLLIGIMVLRRLLLPGVVQGGSSHLPHAMWVIDGAIGFGLGSVVAHNIELWLRARALRASTLSGVFS